MTVYGSLFERLGGIPDKRDTLHRNEAVRASLVAHLTKMLSTRAGSVTTLPDYGLPDLNNMNLSLHNALEAGRSAIASFIANYEPRLSEVRVHSTSNKQVELRLKFTVEGQFKVNGVKHDMSFVVDMQGSGNVTIT